MNENTILGDEIIHQSERVSEHLYTKETFARKWSQSLRESWCRGFCAKSLYSTLTTSGSTLILNLEFITFWNGSNWCDVIQKYNTQRYIHSTALYARELKLLRGSSRLFSARSSYVNWIQIHTMSWITLVSR